MTLIAKNLDAPDQKLSFEHGDLHAVDLAGATVARAVFAPGWRWSSDARPRAGTDSCQAAHIGYVVSGRFHVRMDDGSEAEFGPGDAHLVSAGHDAWVVGDEPCVLIDIAAAEPAADARPGHRLVRCHPCGVEFQVEGDDQLDHLVAAVQQHAAGSHNHEVSREHILSEVVRT